MQIKLLIVDDNDFFRNGLKMMLSRLAYIKEVDDAKDGFEFHEKLMTQNPDIILMDIKMPGMDGIEATKIATSEDKHLKIIALTMFSNLIYLQKMIEAGAKGYILKDAGMNEIEKAILTVMDNKHYYSTKIIDKFTSNQL